VSFDTRHDGLFSHATALCSGESIAKAPQQERRSQDLINAKEGGSGRAEPRARSGGAGGTETAYLIFENAFLFLRKSMS
jgi:hypothetical protein